MTAQTHIAQAEHWLKTVTYGQPLHRDHLDHEDESNGTLRGISPTVLKLAPQLQRELAQELQNAPRPAPTLTAAPKMGPGGNTMRGPSAMRNRQPKPPSDTGQSDD